MPDAPTVTPGTLPAETFDLFDTAEFAVLSTVAADGRPNSSVVWVERDGSDLLVCIDEGGVKERDLSRDPRATTLVHQRSDPYRYVEVRGRVTLGHEGAQELIDRLARKYLDEDRYSGNDGEDVVILTARLTPERVVVR